MSDEAYCYLTTRGRVSGEPREIEIWFALEGRTVYLLSGGRDRSNWVRNLQADPSVRVRIATRASPAPHASSSSPVRTRWRGACCT